MNYKMFAATYLYSFFNYSLMRLFGTNGIRGVIGKDFTPDFLVRVGLAIGTYLNPNSKIIVGTDTRVSGDMVKSAIISGLLATGIHVEDIGILPTPAIQLYTRNHGDFGVVITASHNPPQFNGVKCIAPDGTELPREEEEKIEDIFFSSKFRMVEWSKVGKYHTSKSAIREYINAILNQVNVDKIRKQHFTVVVDCANGASCHTTPYLLENLGCRVLSLNCHPDGTFPGHESEPKRENLEDLLSMVRESHANLGVAHDGDADRAIFVDERGRFLYGDKTLTLVAREFVKERKGIVVTPVSTTKALEEVVNKYGSKVVYTRVGAPIVARKMIETRAVFGGEENGGLIFPEHQYCRDGAMAIAKILEILAFSRKSLGELIDELPKYYQKKISIACENEKKSLVLERLKELLAGEKIDTTDGIKVIGNDWWILIRPSGTEPIYRIYAESKDEKKLDFIVEKYRRVLEKVINET